MSGMMMVFGLTPNI
jgi:ABC-type multidrug transport system fused ATPase/permease subunit